MARAGAQAAAEEAARLIRPKEKPRLGPKRAPAAGVTVRAAGAGIRSERRTLPCNMCFHYGAIVRFRHCDISAKRCRDNCVLTGSRATVSAPTRRAWERDGPGLAMTRPGEPVMTN